MGSFLLPNPFEDRARFPKRLLLGLFLLKRLGAPVVVVVVVLLDNVVEDDDDGSSPSSFSLVSLKSEMDPSFKLSLLLLLALGL